MSIDYLSDIKFTDLPLKDEIKTALTTAGFEFCTPVQAKSLEYSLQGKDVTGQANTGTGKTAAFLVATFQELLTYPNNSRAGDVRALILAPTRELAIQIGKDATALSKGINLNIATVYGGTAYNKQAQQFQRPVDILIGTPGRLIDYWKQKLFTLKYLQVLVLDEADRMFDLGFITDIRFLIQRMPAVDKRLSMLFSATLSQRVLELSYDYMNSPIKIEIKSEKTNSISIKQSVYYPANNEKIPLLIGLIQRDEPFRSVVFVNTKRNAEKIDTFMKTNGLRAEMMSGDVKQTRRQKILQHFEAGKIDVLIATDVAARGLHINNITHVYNFDLPQMSEDYVHRIGRTARAGATGEAVSFACEDTAFYLPEIEAYIKYSLPVESITADLLVELNKPAKRVNNRSNSRRNKGRDDQRRGQTTKRVSNKSRHPHKQCKKSSQGSDKESLSDSHGNVLQSNNSQEKNGNIKPSHHRRKSSNQRSRRKKIKLNQENENK